MAKFEPLVSAVPRRSNFVGSAELLAMMDRHGIASSEPRKWSFATGEGGVLVPIVTPTPRYLFRGQTRRYTPCFPSIYRHYRYPAKYFHQLEPDDAAPIVANFARTLMFYSELQRHPIAKWAKGAGVALELAEIAQHHGIPTPLVDLSASIEVALFFATHEYSGNGKFAPRIEGRGVLYVVDRDGLPRDQHGRFHSAAIQPFSRPYNQWAWSCELLMGECFEECPCLAILEFEHSASLANAIRARAEAQASLFPPDILADLGDAIRSMTTLPRVAVIAAHQHLGRAYAQDVLGPPEQLLSRAGFCIWDRHEPILTAEFWEQHAYQLRTELITWLSLVKRGRETILLRENKAGEPVAVGRFKGPLIAPDCIEIVRQLIPIYTG